MKLLFTVLFLSFCLNLSAQWNPDTAVNTLVVDSDGGDMKAAGTSDGKTYVVFWKSVAAPTNFELRMQVLDVNGNQLLGSDGVLVSNTIPMSTFTVIWNIVVDASDNLFIGVTGTGGGDPAYAFKMDSSGNHLWGPNGVNVGSGNIVTILPLVSGEAIVSWYPGGQALMRKFSSNGTAVWPGDKPVVQGGGATIPANFFELSTGGYILIFHVPIGGINSNLYAQRFDTNGNPVWAGSSQLSNQATAFNRSYTAVQDGDVAYLGYFASSGVRFDSFLQRINSDGSLPWGINGSDFDTSQDDYEMTTNIAFEASSQFIWAVCNYTNTSQSQKGEFIQKFNKITGARQFTETAKEIYPISGDDNVHVGNLQLINDEPLFLLKTGFDNGVSPTVLNAVYLDTNGDFIWPELSRPVATFMANKSRIQFTRNVNNQSVAVFIEEKTSSPKIYAQNFITDPILSTSDFLDNDLVRFTNPVSNHLEIQSDSGIEQLQIYEGTGSIVYKYGRASEDRLIIDATGWSSGIFFLRLQLKGGFIYTFKLIKE